MAERRHISDETWNQHQRTVGGRPVTERINFARRKAIEYKYRATEELLSIGVGSAAFIAGSGALEYYDAGPMWLRVSLFAIGGIDALALPSMDRKNRAKKRDWEEITNREIAVSRPEIAITDTTLARAIYEGELQVTTDDEIANLKQVLDHLRSVGLINDEIVPVQKAIQPATGYQSDTDKKLATLGQVSTEERKKALEDLQTKGLLILSSLKGLIGFSGVVSAGSAALGALGELQKWWSVGISGFFAASSAGQVNFILQQRAENRKLKELLAREETIANHPDFGGDETLARTIYDLDLHITSEQITNLKRVLGSLRKQNILIDPAIDPQTQ